MHCTGVLCASNPLAAALRCWPMPAVPGRQALRSHLQTSTVCAASGGGVTTLSRPPSMCSRPLNLTAREPSLRVGRWQEASTALMSSALVLKLLTSRVRMVGHTACRRTRRQAVDRHNDRHNGVSPPRPSHTLVFHCELFSHSPGPIITFACSSASVPGGHRCHSHALTWLLTGHSQVGCYCDCVPQHWFTWKHPLGDAHLLL